MDTGGGLAPVEGTITWKLRIKQPTHLDHCQVSNLSPFYRLCSFSGGLAVVTPSSFSRYNITRYICLPPIPLYTFNPPELPDSRFPSAPSLSTPEWDPKISIPNQAHTPAIPRSINLSPVSGRS